MHSSIIILLKSKSFAKTVSIMPMDAIETDSCSQNQNINETESKEEPGPSQEHTEDDAGPSYEELLTQRVYFNDLIMLNVIKYVVDMPTRINLEMSSFRLYDLSRKARYNFPVDKDHLGIQFRSLTADVTLKFGTVCFAKPCLTLQTRRDDFVDRRDAAREGELVEYLPNQPAAFIATLDGISRRFSKHVKQITLGGIADGYEHSVQKHQLIITEDILRRLSDGFPFLTQLRLYAVGIDAGAIKYMSSNEFTLPGKIGELDLNSVWFDNKEENIKLAVLATRALKKMKFHYIQLRLINAFLANLRAMDHELDEMAIHFSWLEKTAETKQCLKDMAALCKRLRLRFTYEWKETFYGEWPSETRTHPDLFDVARTVIDIPNVFSLEITARPFNEAGLADYAFLCTNIGKLHNLEELSLHGWSNPILLSNLSRGIENCRQLKSLTITNLPSSTTAEMLTRLIASLPLGIEDLTLYAAGAFEGCHLQQLVKKLPNLVKIDLSSKKFISSDIEAILPELRNLRDLRLPSVTLKMEVLHTLFDRSILPKLESGCVRFEKRLPPIVQMVFQDHFSYFRQCEIENTVHCTVYFDERKWGATMQLPRNKPLYVQEQAPARSYYSHRRAPKKKLRWDEW